MWHIFMLLGRHIYKAFLNWNFMAAAFRFDQGTLLGTISSENYISVVIVLSSPISRINLPQFMTLIRVHLREHKPTLVSDFIFTSWCAWKWHFSCHQVDARSIHSPKGNKEVIIHSLKCVQPAASFSILSLA